MQRLVFLFELDSAGDDDRSRLGLRCMFEEIALHGNSVVLSMNQLTDSNLTHEMIRSDEVRDQALELFSKGVLSYARSPTARTPCQYVLNSIGRALANDGRNDFIFSFECLNRDTAAPRPVVLTTARDALLFSDPSLVRRTADEYGMDDGTCSELTGFVKLILKVSEEDLAYVEPQPDPLGMRFFIDLVVRNAGRRFGEDVARALGNLRTIEERHPDANLGTRSMWYRLLEAEGCFGPVEKRVLDICYNYSLEDMILGASRHYVQEDETGGTFFDDFEQRYARFSDPPAVDEDWNMDWEGLVRIVSRGGREGLMRPDGSVRVYERGFRRSNDEWTSLRRRSFVKAMASPVLFVVIFILTTMFLNDVNDAYGITSESRWLDALWAFPPVVFSLFIDWVMSKLTGYPGISESLHILREGITDHRSIRTDRDHVFHLNRKLLEEEERGSRK